MRKDIIDRLVQLQQGAEIQGYKVTSKQCLEIIEEIKEGLNIDKYLIEDHLYTPNEMIRSIEPFNYRFNIYIL